MEAVPGAAIINLPGCPVNAENLTATIVHILTFGKLPATDSLGRPKFAYGKRIHDNCERRGHFDVDEVVLKVLSKDPEMRYQRASDMANDLRKLMAALRDAPPAQADDAKTMVVPRTAAQPGPAGLAETTTLIEDLDVFARNFERHPRQDNIRKEHTRDI